MGGRVMRRLSHRRPIVVSGQRVAGASFLGWEVSPVKRPRKGHVGSWGSCEEVAAAGAPPPVSKPASPQPPHPSIPILKPSILHPRVPDSRSR